MELRTSVPRDLTFGGRKFFGKSFVPWACLFLLTGSGGSVLFARIAPAAAGDAVSLGSGAEGYTREVRVGLYEENKPRIFTRETGEAAGVFPAILNEIARREEWKLIYVPGRWDECLEALKRGAIDLMPDVVFSGSGRNISIFPPKRS